MPVAGPLSSDVIDGGDRSHPDGISYTVIDVTPSVCDALASRPTLSFHKLFGDAPPRPHFALAAGDTLTVTIWEAGSNGLFGNVAPQIGVTSSRGTTLPPLVVAPDGKITMPYAGRIAVAGKSIAQVEQIIATSLMGKADNPQIVVNLSRTENNIAVVGGEVAKGSRIPLASDGERILDAIADAGGLRIPVNESSVRLTRGTATAFVSYDALLQHPEDNIYLQPGDIVTVTRAPRTFTAFGALGRNYQIAFETDNLSAEEAIAKAGGFLDQRVDPAGVFVFRYEQPELVQALAPGSPVKVVNGNVPVIYRIDMSQAQGYFAGRQFAIRDKDIVYAANARLNEVQKFLNLLGSVLTPAATGASVSSVIH